ncbi:MAG: tryptophan-rich sensory protein [Acidobacteria bacterium]|nr:tryptophan-rich sensory protein [Acidobacteriota bacterium]
MRQLGSLVMIVIIVFGIGFVASLFKPDAWFEFLEKPSWSLEQQWMAPLWSINFALISISSWLVWTRRGVSRESVTAWWLLGIQLGLVVAWSFVLYSEKSLGLAVLCALGLGLAVLMNVVYFEKNSRAAAGLLLPYLLWTGYIGVFSVSLYWLNR